ncbi:MAG: exodeoxyribonuclease VII large subunit [Polyangiaceae bacterium]
MRDRSLTFDFTPKAEPAVEAPKEPPVLSVGDLDRAIKGALEGSFEAPVWVQGEVTGARPAASGHLYFALKDEDEDASIDVAMYKTSLTARSRALVVDGARVRLRGRPSFWAPRGRLQFVADRAEAEGAGALQEALEKLRAKLAAEGLFDPAKKRPLPEAPRIVGVVTSRTGAVIHDICKVAFRRGGARVLLAPALVQGAGAAESIRAALEKLARVDEVDVILVGRGGGSADDLAAFNDEALVRAIRACPVPVVSAVGHEVDVTLTDFAADARAATPSQAAEMVVPDARARRMLLRETSLALVRAMRSRIHDDRLALSELRKDVADPRLLLAAFQQSKDDKTMRLEACAHDLVRSKSEALLRTRERLAFLHPRSVIQRERASVTKLEERIASTTRERLHVHARNLSQASARLDAMSPLKVLGRGYAIASRSDGRAVRKVQDVSRGDSLRVRVDDGVLTAVVDSVEPKS